MQRVEKVIALMLESACGEVSFKSLLFDLAKQFNSESAVLFTINRKTLKVSNWIDAGTKVATPEYLEKKNIINPRMRYSLRHAAGHIVHDRLFISEKKMDQSEFYQIIEKLSGVRYFLGARLFDTGETSVFHSIEFDRDHGPPDDQKIEKFRYTSRCLGNAWKLYCSKSKAEVKEDKSIRSQIPINHLPWAVFSVDSDRQAFAQNIEAQRLTQPGELFAINKGIFQSECADINATIAEGLSKALNGNIQNLKFAPNSKLARFIIQMIPQQSDNSATIIIRDIKQSFDYLDQPLQDLFGLTRVEIKVVKSLARGMNISAVSMELSRSVNTIRNHLRSIYKKTGSDNRAELLVQVLGLLAL